MKKKVIIGVSLLLVAVVLFAGVATLNANKRLEEYQKYCLEDCKLEKVSKEQLEEVKSTRNDIALENIEKYKKRIDETLDYLSSKDNLNDEEQTKLESIKVSNEYNSEMDYNLDDLIKIEDDYKKVSDALIDLKEEFRIRVYTSNINDYQKDIDSTKKKLKEYTLTADEKNEKKKLDKTLTFEKGSDYTANELDQMYKTYKSTSKSYSKLLKDVKKRVEQEKKAEAERQAQLAKQQEQANSYVPSTNTSNNNSNTTSTNTSSNNTNTSNNNSSNNTSAEKPEPKPEQTMPDYCYATMDEAWNYAEYLLSEASLDEYLNSPANGYGGFGVYPGCGGNIDWWEIYWK